MRAPARLLHVGACVAALFFVLPLVGIVGRIPWRDAPALLAHPRFLMALALSCGVATAAVVVDLVIGVPLALVLARGRSRLLVVVRALVTLPLVLPPVIAGVGLLLAVGRRGVLGGPLAALGVELPFTTTGAVVAAAFVSAPFLVLSVEAGLHGIHPRIVEAARSLGASRALRWRAVMLPLLWPSLRTGIALAFARALGEFGATITFAGNLEGRTQTLPLLVYEMLHESPEAAALLSLSLLVVAGLVLALLRAWPRP
jgi:molybdate transport system permease protein